MPSPAPVSVVLVAPQVYSEPPGPLFVQAQNSSVREHDGVKNQPDSPIAPASVQVPPERSATSLNVPMPTHRLVAVQETYWTHGMPGELGELHAAPFQNETVCWSETDAMQSVALGHEIELSCLELPNALSGALHAVPFQRHVAAAPSAMPAAKQSVALLQLMPRIGS